MGRNPRDDSLRTGSGWIDITRLVRDTQTIVWETDEKYVYRYVSDNVTTILGYTSEEITGKKTVWDLHPQGKDSDTYKTAMRMNEKREALVSYENPMRAKDGSVLWVLSTSLPLYDKEGRFIGFRGWDTNITERREMVQKLAESERRFRLLFENMGEAMVIYNLVRDERGRIVNYEFADANPAYEEQAGLTIEEVRGLTIDKVFNTAKPPYLDIIQLVALEGEAQTIRRYFSPLGKHYQISFFRPQKESIAAIFVDVTKEKEIEEKIEFLSYHDILTKLKNRRYYEEKIPFVTQEAQLPLSILLCDLNALKVANDAYGHAHGDKVIKAAARILEKHAPENATLARIGGDEFIVLMPSTSREDAKKVMFAMKEESHETSVDDVHVSISFGLACREDTRDSFETVYKRAEANMYRYKLHEGPIVRRKLLRTIDGQLEKAYAFEKNHAQNVHDYAVALGKAARLSERETEKLSLAAKYHDIGKVALSPEMLKKEGPLSEFEWIEVQRHSEIGYRILASITEMADIAEVVLAHHENIDGTGYPKGMEGSAIPPGAKIIRIADAFDAMTSPRSYKPAMTIPEAIAELESYKGSYFDEQLVDLFVNEVLPGEKLLEKNDR